MHNFGEIVLANVQFTDAFEIKKRPALVLFEEQGNVVGEPKHLLTNPSMFLQPNFIFFKNLIP